MAEEVQQDGQKTLVAFIVGLLIGGMLVWAFSGPEATAPESAPETNPEATATEEGEATSNEESMDEDGGAVEAAPAPELSVGEGNIIVTDQPAGLTVEMEGATYPVSEGWVGVRDYINGDLGYIKGVVRFSESQGLVPENIVLQQPTITGREYAVVVFEEDGDFEFSTAGDAQIPEIFSTFTAE